MRPLKDDKEKYTKMMETVNTVLKAEEKQLIGKPLRKRSMQIWISAADTLLATIAMRLPLPRAAQKYPVENLIGDMRCDTRYEIRLGRDDTSPPPSREEGREHSPYSVQFQHLTCLPPLPRLLRKIPQLRAQCLPRQWIHDV